MHACGRHPYRPTPRSWKGAVGGHLQSVRSIPPAVTWSDGDASGAARYGLVATGRSGLRQPSVEIARIAIASRTVSTSGAALEIESGTNKTHCLKVRYSLRSHPEPVR
jgi:hypothetical protein